MGIDSTTGTLFLAPTPIGNMDDITVRVRDTLSQVDVIACEDSRVTGKLLAKLGIQSRLISYHNYNEQRKSSTLLALLQDGKDVALVTDAGAPGISDPAYRVVASAIAAGIKLVPLPGPTAVIPALTGSGLPMDRFFFEGFPPRTKSGRKKRFSELKELSHTLVFFESPQRIGSTVSDALEVFGNRPACIAREISKIHEEFLRGGLDELSETLQSRKLKGEIVLVIAGKQKVKRVKVNKYPQS
jgi:16S rRNA (cytidine1402-2'-O)-methyltransferase